MERAEVQVTGPYRGANDLTGGGSNNRTMQESRWQEGKRVQLMGPWGGLGDEAIRTSR